MKVWRPSKWTIAAWAGLSVITLGAAGCNKEPETPAPAETTGATSGTTATSEERTGRPAPNAKGNSATGDTIKIGLVASLNGELKPWGDDCDKGAKLAVEEFNAAGGVNGKMIEMIVADSASKPEQGKSAAEKLISDGVVGIIGEVASGITLQMANSAFDKGIPVVAVGATKTTLTDGGNNIFRVCYTDAFQGPVMAKFAFEEKGLRNIAVMTDKAQPYSTGLSNSFMEYFKKLGGTIVDEQFYESKQTLFGPQLENLKAKNPDGLFLSGYFTEVGPIARQAKDAGLKVTLLGGDGWDSTELNTSGGEAIVGGYFCNHYNNAEQRPEVQEFLMKWKTKYGGEPATTMGALGYDATLLVCDALKRATALDSQALIAAIEDTVGFKGVSGAITLKGMNGNPPKRALVVEVTATGQTARKAYEADAVK